MQPIHEDVTRADAVHRRWQLCRNVFPVDVDDESGFAWIVEALADAYSEEGRILLHEFVRDLAFGRLGKRDC